MIDQDWIRPITVNSETPSFSTARLPIRKPFSPFWIVWKPLRRISGHRWS